ncbi:uncharacterized protein BDW47DRAFT_113547 [Aspergillus candidus]|uniref:Ribonuclease H2 subunit B n=1 Tax=Aspergillus candidus TaxID=41067 RepID=A0A2I2EZA1_ASPCN|nr:ribonuclease H2, subunit B [Aspergillus candidus]PLB33689.1 ribonuclease H2, subunit B [Aspergillus candidus]
MPRTRSTAPAKQTESDEPSQTQATSPPEPPSKTFILPSSASDDARFIMLPNPRTAELNRYFFCPKLGMYEFTVIRSTPQAPRSFLFTQKSEQTTKGTIAKAAELAVATPIDMMFFVIPLLAPTSSSQTKGLFQPLDDIIDSQDELPKHLRQVFYNDLFRPVLESRAEAICDSVEAGDEKMLRFNETKLLKELIVKAERMVAQGLPASLEERFIRQALATPLMSVKREDASTNAASTRNGGEGGEEQDPKDTPSATTATDSPSDTTPSTPATEQLPDSSTPDNMAHLLRLSTALSFMKDSYLPKALCARIDELLGSSDTPLDFNPLQEHLKQLVSLRKEALASRSAGDFTRKRSADDDDDAAESRAETKRRKEEEEKKKKATVSRGVKDLKKVDTSGMKKMSDFFTRSAAAKKKT